VFFVCFCIYSFCRNVCQGFVEQAGIFIFHWSDRKSDEETAKFESGGILWG
jgi:hypothetical protein